MKGSSFIQGFWTGLGLGVLAGLMNAKRPGRETRQLLRLKIDRTSQDSMIYVLVWTILVSPSSIFQRKEFYR